MVYMRLLWCGGVVFLVVLAGCQRKQGAVLDTGVRNQAGQRNYVRAVSDDADHVFARRVDGNVLELFRASVTRAESDEIVVVTGRSGGADQGSVLVFGEAGDLVARHRVSGSSPFPGHPEAMHLAEGRIRQLQRPSLGQTRVLDRGDRRFLTVGTVGTVFPTGLEVVEATNAPKLVRRSTVWNRGSLSYYQTTPKYIVTAALNNDLPLITREATYTIGVAVVSAAYAAGDAETVDRQIIVPGQWKGQAADRVVKDLGQGYLYYWLLPRIQVVGDAKILAPSVRGDVVLVPFDDGMTYTLDATNGAVRVEFSDYYVVSYGQMRARDATLPEVSEHQRQMVEGVLIVRPQGDGS